MLREEDVRALLTPAVAVSLVETAFRLQSEGGAVNRPRVRVPYPHGLLHSMSAAVPALDSAGLKAYAAGRAGAQFVVLLFDTSSNTLLAIMEADWLGRMRTGAASGVATRFLANEGASTLGVIGAGLQAETQIESIASVRSLERVKVFSRTAEKRESMARRMEERLSVTTRAVETAEEAVRESEIVVTITNASDPVLNASWLETGTHVNAAGSNRAGNREIDRDTVQRAELVVVDSLEQAQIESGDLIAAAEEGGFDWSRAVELSEVVSGKVSRGSEHSLTLFESQGVAIEDIVTARHVYDRALGEGRGTHVEFGGTR